jgi:predicted HTH transcriptional regulator
MIVSKYLSEKLEEMHKELEVMRPAYESYLELQRAISALERVLEGKSSRGGGRPKKDDLSGNRADQVIHLLKSEPGLTVNALAQKLGTARSYLDRVLRGLEKDGKIERRETSGEGRDRWGYWVK